MQASSFQLIFIFNWEVEEQEYVSVGGVGGTENV